MQVIVHSFIKILYLPLKKRYIPHIATVINEQNTALAAGKGLPGAIHLNLESMMVSNPISVSRLRVKDSK
jgi:hypothetical protein